MKKALFIIGGQRSGTSYFRDLLKQHPKLVFSEPDKPETKFFIKKPQANSEDFFSNIFPEKSQASVFAEKSTSYHENFEALESIASSFTNYLVIFIIRNPVERTISNFFFTKKHGLETRTIEEAFIDNKPVPLLEKSISVNPFDYIKRSLYSNFIPEIENIFKENLLIIDFEEMVKYSKAISNKIFDKLGLQPYEIDLGVEKNEAKKNQIDPKVFEILNKELKEEVDFYRKTKLKYKF